MIEQFPSAGVSQEVTEHEVWDVLEQVVDQAYVEEAKEIGEDPAEAYYSHRCVGISRRVVEQMNAKNISAQVVGYVGWDITNHDFVLLKIGEESWIIDPTWQQFLSQPDVALPKILKAKLVELSDVLQQLNVPEKWRHVWHQALERVVINTKE